VVVNGAIQVLMASPPTRLGWQNYLRIGACLTQLKSYQTTGVDANLHEALLKVEMLDILDGKNHKARVREAMFSGVPCQYGLTVSRQNLQEIIPCWKAIRIDYNDVTGLEFSANRGIE
jgi:hypothetical protein